MLVETVDFSAFASPAAAQVARINGVPLMRESEALPLEALRQRACTELLRQTVIEVGLLDASDPPINDGVISEAASEAIALLLERELQLPEPSAEACRRHHAANPARYRSGERVRVRHILFAVTPGMNVWPCATAPKPACSTFAATTTSQAAALTPAATRSAGQRAPCRTAQAARTMAIWAGSPRPTAQRNSPASCSAMSRSACCRGWCTAASACTWSRC